MSTTRKVGLLGAGYICDSHASALKTCPGVQISAICDLSRGRAQSAANKYGIQHVFTDLDEMLQLKLDAVHILTPPNFHISMAEKILEAGTHVFLEKPMGVDSKSCYAIADLAQRKGLKLGVNHNFLFLPSYEQLYSDVRSGELGQLDQVTVHWFAMLGFLKFGPFDIWMLNEPKNLIFELGSHTTAFILDLLGTPDRIHTTVSRPIDMPGNKRAYRRWQVHGFQNDVAIEIGLSLIPGYTDKSVSVRGSAGTGKYDFERNIYFRDTPSRYSLVWNNFVSARNVAKQIAKGARQNLRQNIISTLQKRPAANPFGLSIERAIHAFYAHLDAAQMDRRLDGHFGACVIEWCEKIAEDADFEQPDREKVWTVVPPLSKPSVLVIGGTGFIGKYLVQKLVDRGYGVRVVSRNQNAGNIALAGMPVELVQGSLSDPAFIDRALEGIDTVYDLAKADGKTWNEYYTNDVLVTKNIAERSLAAGVHRFIYTGTIDSYYSAKAGDTITCDTPLDANIQHRNLYARSKKTCEDLLMEMHRNQGLPLTVFRPGVVIGKGCPPAHWGVGMWQSDNVVQYWGDGRNKLPLVLVEDVAEGLALAMDVEPDRILGRAFNLIDEPYLNAREYAEIVTQKSGIKIQTIPTPIWRHFLVDALKQGAKFAVKHPYRLVPSYRDWNSRAHRAYYDCSITREVLGWKPATSRERIIEEGVKASVQSMLS
ncbi:MAG: NAD-dependent epimerase/dehydratase family protein [Planctomycetales bacterium]|nr:NAD-dependent epimerase/dehydratase family protein [Planctomycetales bacterium]